MGLRVCRPIGQYPCTTPTFHSPAAAVVAFTGQQLLSTLVEETAALAACATTMPNTL